MLRIGTGAGFSADRLDPAVDLITRGNLDYIIFECIGERTLAFGHRDRMQDPNNGYNPLLARRFRAILPLCQANQTKVITNMGVANPEAAAKRTKAIATELGLANLNVAWVSGDDVSHLIDDQTELLELGCTVGDLPQPLIGANAYIGMDAICPALVAGADIIITGRVADPSLFLAPMAHRYGWSSNDWQRLGSGTLIGHLLECAAQVTGGYFADPGFKDVSDLAYVGFPLAEVHEDGSAVITKLPDTGGCVTLQTVKEQLLYEIHDPSAYSTPDVVADFSTAQLSQQAPDRVAISGARGERRPERLKVTVSFKGGYLAEGEISYAGPGAANRAQLAGQIIAERMRHVHQIEEDLRVDLIGVNALHRTALHKSAKEDSSPYQSTHEDVRLRVALRSLEREAGEVLLWEVESLLCCGPAGGGGFRGRLTPSVVTHSAFLAREQISTHFEVIS
ncbi:MAG: acyclic terpene utilization AtuA family protein [Chloroflexota bacterium]